MLEKNVETRLRDQIKSIGGLCLKFVSPGFTGVPDRIILLPGGRVVFAETKRPGKTERPRQELVQGILRQLGFIVYSTVDSVPMIDRLVEDCRRLIYGQDL